MKNKTIKVFLSIALIFILAIAFQYWGFSILVYETFDINTVGRNIEIEVVVGALMGLILSIIYLSQKNNI